MFESKSISMVKNVYVKGFARHEELKEDKRLIRVQEIIKECDFRGKVSTLLDVGCGDGFLALKLGELVGAREIYGVDIAKGAVNLANKSGIIARQLDVDLQDLPYKSNIFDFVYCGSLIELIADPDHLLIEIHRVMKDDGVCLMTVPNICAWGSRIAVMLGYLPYYFRVSTVFDLGKLGGGVNKGRSTGFIRLQSLRSFRQLTDLYGFNIEKVYGAPATGLPQPLSLVDMVLCRFPSLAYQMIFVLKKK